MSASGEEGTPAVPVPEGTDLARAVLARARGRAGASGSGPRARRGRLRPGSLASAGGRRAAVVGQEWSGPGADLRDPQDLAGAVDALVDSHGWAPELSVRGVLARWDLVVGPELAAHCRVERVDGDRVTVRTDSTAWATQVRLLSAHVLRRLADELGEGVVRTLVVLGPAVPSWSHGTRRVKGRGPRDTYG